MLCKIKITCCRCGCSAEITTHTELGNDYSCLNCNCKMDVIHFKTLNNALTAMSELPSEAFGWENEHPGFTFEDVSDCCP